MLPQNGSDDDARRSQEDAARDDGALRTPGRTYHPGGAPKFPNLGQSLLVSNGEPLQLQSVIGAGKPTVALIYSNC